MSENGAIRPLRPMTDSSADKVLRVHKRLLLRAVAVLLGLVLALLAAVGYLLWRGAPYPGSGAAAGATILPTKMGDLSDKEIFTPVPDTGLDFVFYPGLRDDPSWETKVPLRTNWSGMRDPRELQPKKQGVFRVLLLGDSMVAAQAAVYEDGVAPQLEQLLHRNATKPQGINRFEVFPIAVSGWNLFAAVRFAVHNLHVLQPDLVVLALNRNDMDSGSGFVLGHSLVSIYDMQRLRGISHASLGSPTYFLRKNIGVWGLVASDLIPESRRRFEQAAQEVVDLKERLTAIGAQFGCYLYDDYLAPGLARVLPESFPREDILLGPEEVTANNLLPLDGHPNRVGHGHLAKVLAAYFTARGYLEVKNLGAVAPWQSLAEHPVLETKTRATFEVDRIPGAFVIADGVMSPVDGVRCVVGGAYPGGVLSPHSIFALRSVVRPRAVQVALEFPDVPALRGCTLSIAIGGRLAQTLPMSGRQTAEVPVPVNAEISDLLEVRFDADGYFTNPTQGLKDGVWQAAAQIGRLLELRLVVD